MRSARRLALSLALVASAAICMSGTAFAASPGLVISQVYGGGGNTGATYLNDYIELFNRGTVDVPLSGLSLQYASATGTGAFGANATALTPLTGTLAAGHYILVREASGGTAGAPLDGVDIDDPTPDQHVRHRGQGRTRLVDDVARLQRRLDHVLGCAARADHRPGRLRHRHERCELLRRNRPRADPLEHAGGVPRRRGLHRHRSERQPTSLPRCPAARNSATAPHSCAPGDTAPSVVSTAPTNTQTDVPVNSDVTIAFSEDVTVSGSWFSIMLPDERHAHGDRDGAAHRHVHAQPGRRTSRPARRAP